MSNDAARHEPNLAALLGASKLPRVGTTIFTVMSALAAKHGAVNLGQGFPDFDCDPRLKQAYAQAIEAGHNQYAPMTGVPALREAIGAKIERLYGRRYDADTEITKGLKEGAIVVVSSPRQSPFGNVALGGR